MNVYDRRNVIVGLMTLVLSACGGGGGGSDDGPVKISGPQSFKGFVLQQYSADEDSQPVDLDVLQLRFDTEDDEDAFNDLLESTNV